MRGRQYKSLLHEPAADGVAAPQVARAFEQFEPDLVVSVHPLMQIIPARVNAARARCAPWRTRAGLTPAEDGTGTAMPRVASAGRARARAPSLARRCSGEGRQRVRWSPAPALLLCKGREAGAAL